MAGVIAHVNSGACTLVASTAKSLLQIKSAANQRAIVRGLKIMGSQAAGGTDPVVTVRVTRSTANFGTFTSATPAKNNPSDGETLQTTCGKNATVEPTSPTDGGLVWPIQPQTGIIEFMPPGLEIPIPGGQSIQFEATSTGTPTLTVVATFEE